MTVLFFSSVYLFLENVQSKRSNEHGRKKPLQEEQTFSLQYSSLFSVRLFLVCQIKSLYGPSLSLKALKRENYKFKLTKCQMIQIRSCVVDLTTAASTLTTIAICHINICR